MYVAQIKDLIKDESFKTGKAWIKLSRLSQLLYEIRKLPLTKDFFIGNAEFLIYKTPDPDEIYISLPIQARVIEELQHSPSSVNTSPTQEIELLCIDSCEDLEEALYRIIQSLTDESFSKFVDVQMLSAYFYKIYSKPIKPVVNELAPGLKLIDFIQCSDRFLVKQSGKFREVAIAPPSSPIQL